MTRPGAVVYLEGTQGAARQEAAWAVRWLRRDFKVAGARDWSGLERRMDGGVRIALVVGARAPEQPLPNLGRLRPQSRLILIVPEEVRNDLLLGGFPLDGAGWVELGHTREMLPRQVSAGLVHSCFARCRSALRTLPFQGDASLQEVMKVALAPHPTRPFHSVNEMAAVTQRSRRWLNLEWAKISESAGVAHPDLKDLVRGIVLLRALGPWLSGAPMEVCASALETRVESLEQLSVTFLGHKPSELDAETLPPRLMRLERELFGWLLRGSHRDAAGQAG